MDGKNMLKRRRGEMLLTQKQLGYILGVSTRTVKRWEKGLTQPNAEQVGVLLWLLGIGAREWTRPGHLDVVRVRHDKIIEGFKPC